MKRILIMLAMLPLFFAYGCDNEGPTSAGPPERSPLDQQVIDNCYAVQAAAEAFAAENSGYYPSRLSEISNAGNTLVDLLPGGSMLENPYTDLMSVPTNGTAAHPGETRYRPYCGLYGIMLGYLITGYGADGELIALSNLPPEIFHFEDETVANCYLVQAAAEAFAAENNGEYPDNVSVDTTPAGHTLTDLLPGGQLLVNPYTLAATEPIDGAAAAPGQTGYLTARAGGVIYSYVITGYGKCSDLIALLPSSPEDDEVRSGCYRLLQAVEDFAAENGGVYPDNVDVDTTPGGDTVIDLIGGRLLKNPYTEQYTEPGNALAGSRGEVGYEPYSTGGDNVGYTINGWGLNAEMVRFEKTGG